MERINLGPLTDRGSRGRLASGALPPSEWKTQNDGLIPRYVAAHRAGACPAFIIENHV